MARYLGDSLLFDVPKPQGLLVHLWLYRHDKQNQAANIIEIDKDEFSRGESS